MSKVTDVEHFQSRICAFKCSPAVFEIIPELNEITKSSTFMSLWRKQCQNSDVQTLDQVVESVWIPVKN